VFGLLKGKKNYNEIGKTLMQNAWKSKDKSKKKEPREKRGSMQLKSEGVRSEGGGLGRRVKTLR